MRLISFAIFLFSSFSSFSFSRAFENTRNVFITKDLGKKHPRNIDYLIYNTSKVQLLEPESLDKLLIQGSNSLNTLGTFLINGSDSRPSTLWYNYLLENPEELWNYNLVSVEISGNKIKSRKGSSLIFKERELLKMASEYAKTMMEIQEMKNDTVFDDLGFLVISKGDTQIDKIINVAGVFLQYTFLFNFFSFGIMLLLNAFMK